MNDHKSQFIPVAFQRRRPEKSFTDSEKRVLSLLRQHNQLSRADLARQTGLSSQAVIKIVDNLLALELVSAGAPVVNGPGQPSIPMSLAANAAFGFGVSLYASHCTVVLTDLTGNILAEDQAPVDAADRDGTLSAIRSLMAAQTDQARVGGAAIRRDRLFSIGFAASGFFVGRPGQINAPKALEAWALRDLEGELSEAFGLPVWVENDGNAAAVGENLYGLGQTYADFAYIYIAQGLGGGVVAGNQLWRGAHGNAGEFTGLLPPDVRSSRPTLPLLIEILRAHGVGDSDLAAIATRFDPSWPGVEAWLERIAPAFTQILASVAAVHDPQAIVIGGRLPPGLVERMIGRAAFYEVPVRELERPFPTVLASQTKGDAVAFGAAALPFMYQFF